MAGTLDSHRLEGRAKTYTECLVGFFGDGEAPGGGTRVLQTNRGGWSMRTQACIY